MFHKHNLCRVAAVSLLTIGGQLLADECTLSDWYVSKESKEITWPGSVEAVKDLLLILG